MLGLGVSGNIRQSQTAMNQATGASRFLQPVSQCEFGLTTIFEQLQRDPWPVANDRRRLRCTGTALGVAIGLIEAANQNGGARVMLFCGGAATEGPGLVAAPELRESIRSHNDLEKDIAKYWKKAQKVFDVNDIVLRFTLKAMYR